MQVEISDHRSLVAAGMGTGHLAFFAYPLDVRRISYTTNVIESVNRQLRKIINNRGHFPNDEAAAKLIYLTFRNITARWKMPPVFWKATMSQFAIRYPAAL